MPHVIFNHRLLPVVCRKAGDDCPACTVEAVLSKFELTPEPVLPDATGAFRESTGNGAFFLFESPHHREELGMERSGVEFPLAEECDYRWLALQIDSLHGDGGCTDSTPLADGDCPADMHPLGSVQFFQLALDQCLMLHGNGVRFLGRLSFETELKAWITGDLVSLQGFLHNKTQQLDFEKGGVPLHLFEPLVFLNSPVGVLLCQVPRHLAGRGNALFIKENCQGCPSVRVTLIGLGLPCFVAVLEKLRHPCRQGLSGPAGAEIGFSCTFSMSFCKCTASASWLVYSYARAAVPPVSKDIAGFNPVVGAALASEDRGHVYHSVPKMGSNKNFSGANGSRAVQETPQTPTRRFDPGSSHTSENRGVSDFTWDGKPDNRRHFSW